MTLECQGQHLGATLESEAECFRKFSKNVAHEGDSEEVSDVLSYAQSAVSLAEIEF